MQTLTVPAAQLATGDKVLKIEEDVQRFPAYVRGTSAYGTAWGSDNEFMYADLGSEIPRMLLRDSAVVVERPETYVERMAIWRKWLISFRDNCHFHVGLCGWEDSKRGRQLVAAMFMLEHGRTPSNTEEDDYALELQERADETVNEYTFLAPC